MLSKFISIKPCVVPIYLIKYALICLEFFLKFRFLSISDAKEGWFIENLCWAYIDIFFIFFNLLQIGVDVLHINNYNKCLFYPKKTLFGELDIFWAVLVINSHSTCWDHFIFLVLQIVSLTQNYFCHSFEVVPINSLCSRLCL